MGKRSIHIKLDEELYYKAKEVFPRYGELTSVISKILIRVIENPQLVRDILFKDGDKDEV